jgi:hypothetical protein
MAFTGSLTFRNRSSPASRLGYIVDLAEPAGPHVRPSVEGGLKTVSLLW